VQILLSQTDDLVISAQHNEFPDSFIIDIENDKVNHLVSEFNNDFELMASHLKIMNKRMVLLNPVSIILFFNDCLFFRNSLTKCNKMKAKKTKKTLNTTLNNKKKINHPSFRRTTPPIPLNSPLKLPLNLYK